MWTEKKQSAINQHFGSRSQYMYIQIYFASKTNGKRKTFHIFVFAIF